MSSILTNNGAMVALQTLKGINSNLAKTQNEISTGKSVANAKDNAAVWAIAKTMEADVEGFKAIGDSLSLAGSAVAVARTASESVTDLLKTVKVKIADAQNPTADRSKIQDDINKAAEQIKSVLDSAQFNGLNLVNGSAATPTAVKFLSSLNRDSDGAVTPAYIDVMPKSLGTMQAAVAGITVTGTFGETEATAALQAIEGHLKTTAEAAASFGSIATRIDMQSSFVSKLSDTLTSGIGSMVDADMEETSARLQALQVQQQLATQSLSIANQAPQSLLSLFRG